ncbi:MAG: tetrathionate reductase family octaheme c-type cytochrome [Armatimonadota bacterium]
MKWAILILATITMMTIVGVVSALAPRDVPPTPLAQLKQKFAERQTPSVDHSKFAQLQRAFISPQEVTEACIGCHNGRHIEVMRSNHWNWEREEYIQGRGVVYLGKRNAMNNFCLSAEGNELACAKCHTGYGMQSVKTFNFNDPRNVDCLVCHDGTTTYVKGKNQGGAPAPTVNLTKVAQSVGRPTRNNCGVCHFYGGGGNNVKHGDLEEAMFEPAREVDVHMGVDGANMQCVDCHITEKHNIRGQLYSLSSMNRNRVTCEQCHTNTPHDDDLLNEHTLKVACQTCHIPTYAKVNATKTYWDWSTAGKLRNGKPYEEKDAEGNVTYSSLKGTFHWGKNLTPEYVWFNGTADHYLQGDKVEDPTRPVVLNRLNGSYSDPDAKIFPVKIMRTKQPFDPVNNMLLALKLFAPSPGQGAFWKDFDWLRAAETGMRERGLPFSGQVSFIKTMAYWPLNHMVAPKEKAVQCKECHTHHNSRIANLRDFYIPGRDYSPPVESVGKWILLLTLLGVAGHGGLRVVAAVRLRKGGKS